MSTKIAIIYEGVKAEKEIFENLNKNFFSANKEIKIFSFPADGNIYMLWERLKKDEFETDVISIVKEMCHTSENEDIKNLKESEFSEVYLFFDFDIHNNNLYITMEESFEYKMLVGKSHDYADYTKITREMWLAACDASRKRASLIVTYKDTCDYSQFISLLTQDKIYEKQKEFFVKDNRCIAILNSIPLFLLEYFKIDFWKEVIQE